MNRIIIICQISILVLLSGCKVPVSSTKEQNLAKIYNPSSSRIHPAFSVYHSSANASELYVKIFPKELLYSLANSDAVYKASAKVKYELLDITDNQNVQFADSGGTVYNFRREGVEQRFVASIPIAAVSGKFYQLKVSLTDMVRNEEQIRYIYVDKRTAFSQQNFLISEVKSKTPYFPPYVLGNGEFKIESSNFDKYDQIYVLFYGQSMPLPKPSFSVIREKEFLAQFDSIWVLPFKPGLNYMLRYEGMYYFQLDTSVNEGLTILNFGKEFPHIQTPEQLVDPLAYLTTSTEYDQLKNETNQKLAVDNFWLDKSDNMERARELIRIYYNRVYFSNYYFTTFKPGWMTDRGMIYVIYGTPQAIYRSVDDEKWVYYRKSFSSSLTFTFSYMPSPYSENNFVLERSESYDTYWREAVNSWKNGKVFNLD